MVSEFRCLDDKHVCLIFSLTATFNVDLSLREMRKNFLKNLWAPFMNEVQPPHGYRANRDSLLLPLSPK